MARKRDRSSHFVQVARFRMETAIIEINGDAIDDDEAMALAIEQAEWLPASAWAREPFDRSAYRSHVQSIISREEINELAEIGSSASVEKLVDARDHTRYLLLMANSDTAEGELILQPWLVVDQPDLLASDLCRTWIGSIEGLGLTNRSERLDDLAAGSKPLPSDQVIFGVKPRRKPRP